MELKSECGLRAKKSGDNVTATGILGSTGKSTGPPTFNLMKASVAVFVINIKQNINAGGRGAILVTIINSYIYY